MTEALEHGRPSHEGGFDTTIRYSAWGSVPTISPDPDPAFRVPVEFAPREARACLTTLLGELLSLDCFVFSFAK